MRAIRRFLNALYRANSPGNFHIPWVNSVLRSYRRPEGGTLKITEGNGKTPRTPRSDDPEQTTNSIKF